MDMPYLPDVIDEIMALESMPDKEREELRAGLEDVKSSAEFAPPEGQKIFWELAAENLQEVLGKPDCDWKHEVHAIFTRKPTSNEGSPMKMKKASMLDQHVTALREKRRADAEQARATFTVLKEAIAGLEIVAEEPSTNGRRGLITVQIGGAPVHIYSYKNEWSAQRMSSSGVNVIATSGTAVDLEKICDFLAQIILEAESEEETQKPKPRTGHVIEEGKMPKVPSSEDRVRPVEGE